jgi:hypothetical protein
MIDQHLQPASRRIEKTVLSIGVLLILIPTAVFVLNIQITERFFGARDVLSQSNIGEIIRPKKIVKKRSGEDSAYGSASQGDPIYVGDTVMTGKDSFTRVNLSDGSVLDLGPDTLVRIEPVRSFSFKGIKRKLKITVEAGAVKAKAKVNSAPIVLESATGEVLKEIAPPPVVMAPPTPAPIAVVTPTPAPAIAGALPGSQTPPSSVALPATPTPVAVAVEEDEFFEAVVAAPTPPPAPAPIAKKAESAIAKFFGSKSEPVTVATPAPVASPSASATPGLIAKGEPKPEPKASQAVAPIVPAPAPVAAPVFRFDPEVDTKKTEVAPLLSKAVITVKKPVAVQVLTPEHKGILPDTVKLEDQHFNLSWKDGGVAVKPPYTVWIEHNGNREKRVTEENKTVWNIPLEAEGKIEWWVEVALRDEGKIESKKQLASWAFPTPKLSSPANQLEVPDFYLIGPKRDLTLTWKSSPICKKFEVAVSKMENFTSVLLKTETDKNFQNFSNPAPGTYYWRVACDYTDSFRLFSKPSQFIIK